MPRSGKGSIGSLPSTNWLIVVAEGRVVSGAVDAAGLHDHAGQALLGDQPLGDLVGPVLGLLVVGGELGAGVLVGLVDDLAVGVAEGGDGRDVDDLRDLLLERRPQHRLGAEDVGLVHRRVLALGDPDLVDRGAVDDRVGALHPGLDRGPVGEVALGDGRSQRLQPAALLAVAGEADDLVAALEQPADDVLADEPGPTGYEDLHRRKSMPGAAIRTIESSAEIEKRPADRDAQGRRGGRRLQPPRPAAGAGDRHHRRPRAGRPAGRAEGAAAHRRRRHRRRDGPAAGRARPRPLPGPGQAGRAEGGDRRLRREPGRLRRRAGAAPGAKPGGGARGAGDRPHRGDPRHLRRPRPLGRGQAPGRAGPARVQPGPDARPVDASRAPRRRHRHPRARASRRSRPTAASPATGSRPCAAGWPGPSATGS